MSTPEGCVPLPRCLVSTPEGIVLLSEDLFQIVLGLMYPRGPSGGGKSQNEAKSRRFGMNLPSMAFYEGVNPKTILNNCPYLLEAWPAADNPRGVAEELVLAGGRGTQGGRTSPSRL